MKTLSVRDKIIILVVIFLAILYGFYKVAYAPLKEKKVVLNQEISEIENSYPESSIASLESHYNELNIEKNDFQNQIEAIKEVKNFGDANYQEFITFLGEKASIYNIDITKLNKEEIKAVNSYWEREYALSIEGTYSDLVKYVNSMYSYDTYFVIKGLKISEVATTPMTGKVREGNEELLKGTEYLWLNSFSEKLDSTIPSKYLEENEKTDGEGENAKKVTPEYINKRMQIEFTFSFISLEQPDNEEF